MALTKLPTVRTPLNADGVWIVPVSKALRLGCLLNACPSPACPCTELKVSAYSFDERTHAFGFKNGKLISSTLPLDDRPVQIDKPMALRLDVYTGELRGDDDSPIDLQERRVAAISDALDAETLDELEALWRRQKGLASSQGRRQAEIEPWVPGELLYWDAVFEVDRLEMFQDGDRRVVALDMYCVAPGCECREVTISFQEEVSPGDEPPPPIGLVVAAFDGKLRFQPRTPSDDARLRALWVRYRRRHPELRMAFDRYAKVRAFAAAHATEQALIGCSALDALASVSASRAAGALAIVPSSAQPRPDERIAQRWVSSSRKRNKAAQRRG